MTDAPSHEVYRAPQWSRLDSVSRADAVAWALDAGVCGVGGRLSSTPADLDDAVERVAVEWDSRVARRLRRFALVEPGAVVWTREGDGLFRRGSLTGPWRFEASPEAFAHDLAHVRSCRWATEVQDPPPVVLEAFARGGRNFQRIRAV